MTTQTNNLVTRISELEAERDRYKKSLRDEFAMAVLNGMLANATTPAVDGVRDAYRYADIMIYERERL